MGREQDENQVTWSSTENPAQLIRRSEHPLLYKFGYLTVVLPFFLLMPLSLIWPMIPDSWLQFDWMHQVDSWLRLNSEKLNFEAKMYDEHGPFTGNRHVLFVAICGIVFLVTNFVLMLPVIILTWWYGHSMKTGQRISYWFLPLMLIIVIYCVLFNQFDDGIGRTSHLAETLFGSWLVFPITAGLWSMASMVISNLAIMITKILRHRSF